jgi:hypothetical protein
MRLFKEAERGPSERRVGPGIKSFSAALNETSLTTFFRRISFRRCSDNGSTIFFLPPSHLRLVSNDMVDFAIGFLWISCCLSIELLFFD